MSQGRGFLGRRNLETIRRTGGCLVGLMLCGSGLVSALLYGQSAPPAAKKSSKGVALQVIVVSTPEQASEVLQRLKAGDDFATLAKEKSIDPTADSGGFMGRTDPAALRPELRESLKGVAPGRLSPITRIPSGYAILKVIPESGAEKTENVPRARLDAVSAYGSVAYSLSVSGLLEADEALLRFPKVSGWQRDPTLTCQMRTESLAAGTERLEKFLAPANHEKLEQQKPLDLAQEHFALAELYCYAGNMDAAIEQYEQAYR
ncbi:MAG TPA: peptidylprolyl isomerase, partial [Candidatus Sulfotelmatobacter sp.]|nr:peptidylprolyl isomerase [Candidatus Sulfotelmatobacter sp.]